MKCEKFHLKIKLLYSEEGQTLEQVAQSSCGVSLEILKDLAGHGPGQPAVGDLSSRAGLNYLQRCLPASAVLSYV